MVKSIIMFWLVSCLFVCFFLLGVMRVGDASLLHHGYSYAEILVVLNKSCLCADTALFSHSNQRMRGVVCCILNYT